MTDTKQDFRDTNIYKTKAVILKDFIKQLNCLVDECMLKIEESGWYTKAVDTAHICMVEAKVDKNVFETWEVKFKDPIFIDVEKFKIWLKQAKDTETVTLKAIRVKDGIFLRLSYRNFRYSTKIHPSNNYTISDPKIPNLDLPAEFSLPTAFVRESIKALAPLTDHVLIKASEEDIKLMKVKEKGEDEFGASELECVIGRNFVEDYKNKEKMAKSMFPLDYMDNIIKTIRSSMVTIKIGNDYPIKIIGKFAGGRAQSMFLLAPRVEGE